MSSGLMELDLSEIRKMFSSHRCVNCWVTFSEGGRGGLELRNSCNSRIAIHRVEQENGLQYIREILGVDEQTTAALHNSEDLGLCKGCFSCLQRFSTHNTETRNAKQEFIERNKEGTTYLYERRNLMGSPDGRDGGEKELTAERFSLPKVICLTPNSTQQMNGVEEERFDRKKKCPVCLCGKKKPEMPTIRACRALMQSKYTKAYTTIIRSSTAARKQFFSVAQRAICKELKKYSKSSTYTNQKLTLDLIKNFSWKDFYAETSVELPFLHQVLEAVLASKSRKCKLRIENKDRMGRLVPALGMIISALLYHRNRNFKLVPGIVASQLQRDRNYNKAHMMMKNVGLSLSQKDTMDVLKSLLPSEHLNKTFEERCKDIPECSLFPKCSGDDGSEEEAKYGSEENVGDESEEEAGDESEEEAGDESEEEAGVKSEEETDDESEEEKTESGTKEESEDGSEDETEIRSKSEDESENEGEDGSVFGGREGEEAIGNGSVETKIEESSDEYNPDSEEDMCSSDDNESGCEESICEEDNPAVKKSVLQNHFKDITIPEYHKVEGGRNYQKCDYCFYCEGLYNSKISVHYRTVHCQERRVADIFALPVGSPERKKASLLLQNEGNFKHNMKVIQQRKGELVVGRRVHPNSRYRATDFLPCEYCYAFILRDYCWKHAAACLFKPKSEHCGSTCVRNGQMMIAPFITVTEQKDDELLDLIYGMKERAKNPMLKKLCLGDSLLKEFGLSLLARFGSTREQRTQSKTNIRTKLRTVARLLSKLREGRCNNSSLASFINGVKLMDVIKAVTDIAVENDAPNVALSLGNYLKQIALIKRSIGIRNSDVDMKQEACDFLESFEAHWNSKVSSVAIRRQKLRAISKEVCHSLTQDLITLSRYLDNIICQKMKIIDPAIQDWTSLAQHVLVQIVLFNKRRPSEVEEMTLTDFMDRRTFTDNEEVLPSMSVTERLLAKRMNLVTVTGKSTRGVGKVFVLLTADMVRSIDHLVKKRECLSIDQQNQYVFASEERGLIDGCKAFEYIAGICPELVNGTAIHSTDFREYLGTTSQIVDMKDAELKTLAGHMSQTLNIHANFQQLQRSVFEKVKAARVLTAVDNGIVNRFGGHSQFLDSINVDELPLPISYDDSWHTSEPSGDLEDNSHTSNEGIVNNDPTAKAENCLTLAENSSHEDEANRFRRKRKFAEDSGKRVQWTPEQLAALENAFGHIGRYPKGKQIEDFLKNVPCVKGRTVPQIRSKIQHLVSTTRMKFHRGKRACERNIASTEGVNSGAQATAQSHPTSGSQATAQSHKASASTTTAPKDGTSGSLETAVSQTATQSRGTSVSEATPQSHKTSASTTSALNDGSSGSLETAVSQAPAQRRVTSVSPATAQSHWTSRSPDTALSHKTSARATTALNDGTSGSLETAMSQPAALLTHGISRSLQTAGSGATGSVLLYVSQNMSVQKKSSVFVTLGDVADKCMTKTEKVPRLTDTNDGDTGDVMQYRLKSKDSTVPSSHPGDLMNSAQDPADSHAQRPGTCGSSHVLDGIEIAGRRQDLIPAKVSIDKEYNDAASINQNNRKRAASSTSQVQAKRKKGANSNGERQAVVKLSKRKDRGKTPRSVRKLHINNTLRQPRITLYKQEKAWFRNYVQYLKTHGFPVTFSLLRSAVCHIVKSSAHHDNRTFVLKEGPPLSWFKSFLSKKNKNGVRMKDLISSRTTTTTENVELYFNVLRSLIKDLGLEDDPDRIYNCGEFKLGELVKVQIDDDGRDLSLDGETSDEITGQSSLQFAVTASGRALMPFLIVQNAVTRTHTSEAASLSRYMGFYLNSSDTGSMNEELFHRWFSTAYICADKTKPKILLMNNSSSFLSPSLFRMALRKNVHLIYTPPEVSHNLLPLDHSIFGLFKHHMKQVLPSSSSINCKQLIVSTNSALSKLLDVDVKLAFNNTCIFSSKPPSAASLPPTPLFLEKKLRQKNRVIIAKMAQPVSQCTVNQQLGQQKNPVTQQAMQQNPILISTSQASQKTPVQTSTGTPQALPQKIVVLSKVTQKSRQQQPLVISNLTQLVRLTQPVTKDGSQMSRPKQNVYIYRIPQVTSATNRLEKQNCATSAVISEGTQQAQPLKDPQSTAIPVSLSESEASPLIPFQVIEQSNGSRLFLIPSSVKNTGAEPCRSDDCIQTEESMEKELGEIETQKSIKLEPEEIETEKIIKQEPEEIEIGRSIKQEPEYINMEAAPAPSLKRKASPVALFSNFHLDR